MRYQITATFDSTSFYFYADTAVGADYLHRVIAADVRTGIIESWADEQMLRRTEKLDSKEIYVFAASGS